MARSPFTLAAAVTAALPGAEIIGTRELHTEEDGRFDAAVVTLADGRDLAIRVATDDSGSRELATESLALRALTTGARALLPFALPQFLGETLLGEDRALVTDYLPGFQIDAAHLPPGPGAARSVGEAIAAIHALSASVVRSAGLPERNDAETRADLRRLTDRAASTGHVPARLIVRWREALDDESLWQFGATVTLGGAQAHTFLYEDDAVAGPTVTAAIGWQGLRIGDPAIDLAWLATAPEAAESVFEAYAHASARSADDALKARARLHAELEFVHWLVHGEELRRADIVADATALLEALAESVREGELATITPDTDLALQSALGAVERMPEAAPSEIDTSIQTDAYTPEELWVAQLKPVPRSDDSTGDIAPLEEGTPPADEAESEAQRAARAALQRWSSSASE